MIKTYELRLRHKHLEFLPINTVIEVASSRVRTEVRNRAAAALEHRQHWSSTHKPELNAEIISLTVLRT